MNGLYQIGVTKDESGNYIQHLVLKYKRPLSENCVDPLKSRSLAYYARDSNYINKIRLSVFVVQPRTSGNLDLYCDKPR